VTLRTIRVLSLGLLITLVTMPLAAAPRSGKLAGVVVDPAGTPQMGATVLVAPEQVRGSSTIEVLTNGRGQFTCASLLPGLYTIHVTLAGFLPTIEEHILINDQRTTLLQVELGSIFSSFDHLRRQPNQAVNADEWTWVLRTSSATRPVLRWGDGEVLLDGQRSQSETNRKNRPRGRLELSAGTRHPGSVSNLADAPSTAFAYDQKVGSMGRLLLAGQFSREGGSTAGAMASVWMPAGDAAKGSVTSLVVREAKLGPGGLTYRGLRLEHDSQVAIGDRISLRYGAEFVMAGLEGTSSALRPRAQLTYQLAPSWRAGLLFSASPWQDAAPDQNSLQAALDQLDSLPPIMVRDGRSSLANDWHEELAIEHVFNSKSSLVAAGFRDRSRNTAIYGRGASGNPDYLQDFFSSAFVYDGGSFSSWGGRLAYRQKFSDNLDGTLVYAYAGALAPDASATRGNLRDIFQNRYRHSLAARISSRLPETRTQFAVSYKWVSGTVVSRQDAYGDAAFRLEPYLNLMVRQPLPSFFSTRMVAMADFGNLLAEGYVPIKTSDGRVLLVPSYRSFRGGLSLEF
jgi:hypothetical protein